MSLLLSHPCANLKESPVTKTPTTLGLLIRTRREQAHMSMDDLATRARVSRSTIHRIEHGHKTRSTAPKLAQVLVVLDIKPDELRPLIADERYLGDVLHWMEGSTAFANSNHGLRAQDSMSALDPDVASDGLVVFKNGQMATVRGSGLDAVKATLKAAGWLIAHPE